MSVSGPLQQPPASRVVLQGGLVQGASYPAPAAGLALWALNMPGAALGVREVDFMWLSSQPHCHVELPCPLHKITSSWGEGCAPTLTLPSSYAQLLAQGSPLFSSIMIFLLIFDFFFLR